VQENFHVSASGLRHRRIAGVFLGPFIGALLLLRLYLSGPSGSVGPLIWVAFLGVVIFTTCVATYSANGWSGAQTIGLSKG